MVEARTSEVGAILETQNIGPEMMCDNRHLSNVYPFLRYHFIEWKIKK